MQKNSSRSSYNSVDFSNNKKSIQSSLNSITSNKKENKITQQKSISSDDTERDKNIVIKNNVKIKEE